MPNSNRGKSRVALHTLDKAEGLYENHDFHPEPDSRHLPRHRHHDLKPERDHDEKQRPIVKLETQRKIRLQLLAGMIYARLGTPDAVVEETAPNSLNVKIQDLSWKVTVSKDGSVNISGFDSGAEQYVGKIPSEDSGQAILKVSEHIHKLVSEDVERKAVPPEPPVHFGPEDEADLGGTAPETAAPPPVAPAGDQGAAPGGMDLGLGGAPGLPGGAPAGPGAAPGGPPAGPPPPGGAPPAPGAGPGPPGPQASRGRFAAVELDRLADYLERIGQSLGGDGVRVFRDLAARVDRVTNTVTVSDASRRFPRHGLAPDPTDV